MQRRQFIKSSAGASAVAFGLSLGIPLQALAGTAKGKVVVIGGGFAGATAAKYLKILSNNNLQVTIIEPNLQFVSCPMSNLVVGGVRSLAEIATPYTNLKSRHGVDMVQSTVTSVNTDAKTVQLANGSTLAYDRLVMAPGIDLMLETVEGLQQANATGATVQAWKAGWETAVLRQQLQAMEDGGTYIITVPKAPYRCPPGPYERASLVANYFKQHKPKSKVLILDANENITSKGKLFSSAWKANYGNMIEYRPNHKVMAVDAANKTVQFEFEEPVKGDVLNILPEMRGGTLAVESGIANLNNRWAEVNYMTFESKVAPHVYVIGDTIQVAPKMPKSGHMANSQAKVAAAAIVAEMAGWEPNDKPVTNNTCYSYINSNEVIHVASVHQFNAEKQTFLAVEGAGGLSPEPSALEGQYAWSWAQNIWADTLA